MKSTLILMGAIPLTAALVLSACGGGSSGDSPPPQASDPLATVPPSASQSPTGMVGYLNALPALDAEKRDPVSLDGFAAPVSDDTEPQAIGS